MIRDPDYVVAWLVYNLHGAELHLKADALNGSSCVCLQVCIAVAQAADKCLNPSALHHQCYTGLLIADIQDYVCCFSCNWLADDAAEVLKNSLDALSADLQPVVSAPGQNLQNLQ